MAKFLAQKRFNTLIPYDEAGEEALAGIPHKATVTVEVKQPRNPDFHRKYWALVSLVWQNVDQSLYPTMETLHEALKISAGLRTEFHLPSGKVGFIPGSISFAKMDDTAFNEFFNTVCRMVGEHFIPGLEPGELRDEVERIIGAA